MWKLIVFRDDGSNDEMLEYVSSKRPASLLDTLLDNIPDEFELDEDGSTLGGDNVFYFFVHKDHSSNCISIEIKDMSREGNPSVDDLIALIQTENL